MSKVEAMEMELVEGGVVVVMAGEAPYLVAKTPGRERERKGKERIRRTVWISILCVYLITSLTILNFKLGWCKSPISQRIADLYYVELNAVDYIFSFLFCHNWLRIPQKSVLFPCCTMLCWLKWRVGFASTSFCHSCTPDSITGPLQTKG